MQKRGEKNLTIWKRKHKCSICKQDVYFDDKKDIMACGCGKFTTKSMTSSLKKILLRRKFKKTYHVRLVFHGFEPFEIQ